MVSFRIRPQIKANFARWPLGLAMPFLTVAGRLGVTYFMEKKNERNAFLSSGAYLAGMLTSVVFGVYPMAPPARDALDSLTIDSAKAGGTD